MNKQIIIRVVVLLCLIAAGLGTKWYVKKLNSSALISDNIHTSSRYESQMPDFSDDRILLGLNHVSFVGRVLQQVGNENIPSSNAPGTQFTVQTLLNIKGNLQGIVTVAQIEAIFPANAHPLVQIGSTYLFTARYLESNDWYAFGNPLAYKLISSDTTLSDVDLKQLAANNSDVIAMQQAYPNEVLSYHEKLNSYASRHYDAQGNLIDDTVVLHQQYLATHPSVAPNVSPADNAAPVANTPAADSVSPTPTPNEVVAPIDTPTPTPAASDSTVPAAS